MPSVERSQFCNMDTNTDTAEGLLIAECWFWWHERMCRLCRLAPYGGGSAFSCTGSTAVFT